MTNPTLSPSHQFEQGQEVWQSLKLAISACSGFKNWQQDQTLEEDLEAVSLDDQVSSYLRDTLETLAY